MPLAARIGDEHICPQHGGGPILTGCPSVIIGGEICARVTDLAECEGAIDVIAVGSATVIICYEHAARVLDTTEHGGIIVEGCPTVVIG
jgi:uncharacterized Zn-binding protein involved in type VI secretion